MAATNIRNLTLILVIYLNNLRSSSPCPPRCSCYLDRSDVDCNYAGLKEIPSASSVPSYAQKLRLKSNYIHLIPTRAFEPLNQLWNLDLSNNRIRALDNQTFLGLTSLEFLSLSSNSIQAIEENTFEMLSSLKTLILNNNCIGFIDAQGFAGLFNLLFLDLSENVIQEFTEGMFSDLVALAEIRISGNNITWIASGAFVGLSSLPSLNLSSNQIGALREDAFHGVKTTLQRLSLEHNNLTTIPPNVFNGFPALEEISFYNNSLRSISVDSFTDLPSLFFLDLKENRIATLKPKTFQNLPDLIVLDLSYNQLDAIKGLTFVGLREVMELRLEFNQIQELESYSFFGCSSLSVLNLQNNQLHAIHPKAFEGAYFLTTIKLDNNKLTTLPSEVLKPFRLLHEITLSNNSMSVLQESAFQGLVHVRSLDLSMNNLSMISQDVFNPLVNLRVLNLSGNFITTIANSSLSNLPKLKLLNISNNFIQAISCNAFRGSGNLEMLNLHQNRLTSVPTCALTKTPLITKLILSANRIHELEEKDFSKLDSIQEIYVQNNTVRIIHPLTFFHLGRLNILNLDNNELTAVHQHWFTNSLAIQYLSLSHNKIQVINHRLFGGFKRIETFSAVGNPWACNCSNFWMTANRSIFDLKMSHLYVCDSPVSLRGTNAFKSISDIPCTLPKIIRARAETFHLAVKEEEPLRLTCKASGFPAPKIYWVLPDRTKRIPGSSGSDVLMAMEPRTYKSGYYSCIAENEVGMDKMHIFVDVIKALSVTVLQRFVAVDENGTANLTCLTEGYPEPEVHWVSPSGHKYLGYQHILESVGNNDVGKYYCVAKNSQSTVNDSALLAFSKPPLIKSRSTNFTFSTGQNIVLPCLSIGFPPPVVIWKLPSLLHIGSNYTGGRIKVLENGDLIIENLDWNATGIYICDASNLSGTDSVQHFVSVREEKTCMQLLNPDSHYKKLILFIVVLVFLIGVAALFARIATRKKKRLKIIRVQPFQEKNQSQSSQVKITETGL
ncbi:UNVERIFIED_CONTAM: hypothetical protein FKN15_005595 [Acipenser sinensis]